MILLTGAAGFIGSSVALKLAAQGHTVLGVDNLNTYYSKALKQDRLNRLKPYKNFNFNALDIADISALKALCEKTPPTHIVHLAAQAGVRYSIENPDAYVQSNLVGHANMLEIARIYSVKHMIYASSSSVYGGNETVPFSEDQPTDDPVSFYGATKKSNEVLSNSYARLYKIPLTGLRFFTVYGPWGRPDMAYWLFTEAISKGKPIEVFNQGEMRRDFTYIDDIVDGMISALNCPPDRRANPPHTLYNLGNDQPEKLIDFIALIEEYMGKPAEKIMKPMQDGDVVQTWANIDRARQDLGYNPKTALREGLKAFVSWYKVYHAL